MENLNKGEECREKYYKPQGVGGHREKRKEKQEKNKFTRRDM